MCVCVCGDLVSSGTRLTIEEPQLLISADSSIGDVLLTKNLDD